MSHGMVYHVYVQWKRFPVKLSSVKPMMEESHSVNGWTLLTQ